MAYFDKKIIKRMEEELNPECENNNHEIKLLAVSKDSKGIIRQALKCNDCKTAWFKISKSKEDIFPEDFNIDQL